MSGVEQAHIPVLLDDVMTVLAPKPGETHVDGTYGAGGYTKALLERGARVIAFDRDPAARAAAAPHDRLTLIADTFSTMVRHVTTPVDGVTLDIGVSSMQLDQAERGFSIQADGPLDMRMSQAGMSAADFLNTAAEADIADVIYRYGEEPKSRRIARAIVAARPITRTSELASLVRRACGYVPGRDKKDPAIRTFQAIRIHINRELDELEEGLEAAEAVLKPGGRLAVVTFHSLEDRIVKQFLAMRSGKASGGSRHLPVAINDSSPTFTAILKAVRPDKDELARNPRARSATLRSALRTTAAASNIHARRET
ncbi:MAG: 16S rRNA (cytosine(1402)-N(4))-methyltransferase RsmH [Alphaproteobacteria bacterium]|nr:16S rRNA (cytosine(1402)-N(4))-methyltransferase RsmH [Alphaproteobacteria bacterium]MDE2041946.1 16S rRNA (cytosine(1402)-N(4))-methyltransferase RsmH [Alphaproteobacteria bacterium]MDE2341652.1 16S rRNA (cytosine(1402)-N(4))-methyltransferase RsmH [Alphaproteobacteria bacterium]